MFWFLLRNVLITQNTGQVQGRIQDFKLGGAHLKKLHRAEGGANIFGVFCVKNYDLTQTIFFFSNFRGDAPVAPPSGSAPEVRFWLLCENYGSRVMPLFLELKVGAFCPIILLLVWRERIAYLKFLKIREWYSIIETVKKKTFPKIIEYTWSVR